MRRFLPLLVVLAACERGAPEARGAADDVITATSGMVFERHLLFVGGAPAAPVAAVYDFTVIDHGSRLERTALSWVLRDGRWRPLLNATWAHAPMRDPWRLVPHGGLRIIAAEDGELELVYREGATTTRLLPSSGITQWTGPRSREILLRYGALSISGEDVHGSIFDLQLQRASGSPRPAGPAAFLTDGDALHIVLFAEQDTAGVLWIRAEDVDELWSDLSLTRPATGDWRGTADNGAIRFDLSLTGEPTPVAEGAEVQPARGTLTLRGQRYTVFGLVRSAPS